MTDYFTQIAPIWDEFFEPTSYFKMSMKKREELLQVHRDALAKEQAKKAALDDSQLIENIKIKTKQREEQRVADLFKEWKNK